MFFLCFVLFSSFFLIFGGIVFGVPVNVLFFPTCVTVSSVAVFRISA